MNKLRIERVEVTNSADLVRPGDDAHVVAVHADGVSGWYGPVGGPAATLIKTCIGPLAIGASVVDHDGLLARLRHAIGAPVGAIASWAIGALDCAVWDLHGRAEGLAVAALLGSADTRPSVPAYASWLRLDVATDAGRDTVRRVAGEGWRFTKWSLRPDPCLDIDADAKRLASVVHQVTEAAGAPAAFDALWTWDEPLTLRFADVADPASLIWLEEPLNSYDLKRYLALARSGLPLALGERLHLGDEPGPLLDLPALTAFTVDTVGCGGITTAAGLIRQALASRVPVYPHGRSLVPAVHLAAAFPDAIPAVEYQIQWEPRRQRLFTEPLQCDSGRVLVPQGPGLGPMPRRP